MHTFLDGISRSLMPKSLSQIRLVSSYYFYFQLLRFFNFIMSTTYLLSLSKWKFLLPWFSKRYYQCATLDYTEYELCQQDIHVCYINTDLHEHTLSVEIHVTFMNSYGPTKGLLLPVVYLLPFTCALVLVMVMMLQVKSSCLCCSSNMFW